MKRNFLLYLLLVLCPLTVGAQTFFNLTAADVKIDGSVPYFTHSVALGDNYADSVYTVKIEYPEFINMSNSDINKLKAMGKDGLNGIDTGSLPEMPVVEKNIVVERRKGRMEIGFSPIVFRDGKYKKLVSFMLRVEAKARSRAARRANAKEEATKAERYAKNSVLASGRWVKIRVPSTGVYQITDALLRQAGFSDPTKVKVYGYGGALHKEELSGESIMAYDDLKEVATCTVNGKRLFRAVGTVTWETASSYKRTRNPYSDYGYYFLTQSDGEPLSVDSATFVSSFYPDNGDYHLLHEVDNYAWYQGGRNLYESTPVNAGATATYNLNSTADQGTAGKMYIVLSWPTAGGSAEISVNDSVVGRISKGMGSEYDHGLIGDAVYTLKNLQKANSVKVTNTGSSQMRLDYIAITFQNPRPEPKLSVETFPAPEYVYTITNQNHHADKACDMVIIVPTSQKTVKQAEQLKAYHEKHDNMKVRIVPADELYNEFSSGTPEADAYRLYMKMLYDRAETEEEMPKYLVLFGNCVWDNRMNTTATSTFNPDDYLLCFESENSVHGVICFVDDNFFCALDDGEGKNASANTNKTDKYDVAVGRFPVTTADEAQIMVDKAISYMDNENAGSWQNVAMFMGDDGNDVTHTSAADGAAKIVEELCPALEVKRVFWDMYPVVTTATGNTYPEITNIVKKQQNEGVLLMNYCGHGRADQISHEKVLKVTDFSGFKNKGLSLWITASCDIMPYDGTIENIGKTAVLNPTGGAIAFFGTTRTVYTNYNRVIDEAFLRALFTKKDGKYISIGEAQRLAKNELATVGSDVTCNKLQYAILGDPAIVLNVPEGKVVIDSINGVCLTDASELPEIKAGSTANIKGHVEFAEGVTDSSFNGMLSIKVKDSKEKVVGRMNDKDPDTGTFHKYVYYDHLKTIFNGNDSIRAGKFDISFAVTKDINYADDNGMINVFAIDKDGKNTASGMTEDFFVGGTADIETDSIGPSVFCYLNSPTFSNGGNVNCTPYFVAEISDKDGLNTSGSGIGHDLTLVIDDDPLKTYTLNDNFAFDFGSYTKGSTYYYIPELEEGMHKLKFTAWDILNNPTTTTLKFNVVRGLTPRIASISCSDNPAKTGTTFIVNHDRGGSNVDVRIEVLDVSGRLLWAHNETGVSETSTYTYKWDLCTDGGGKLQSGVYLYRVRLSSDGSSEVSKAKKIIVLD